MNKIYKNYIPGATIEFVINGSTGQPLSDWPPKASHAFSSTRNFTAQAKILDLKNGIFNAKILPNNFGIAENTWTWCLFNIDDPYFPTVIYTPTSTIEKTETALSKSISLLRADILNLPSSIPDSLLFSIQSTITSIEIEFAKKNLLGRTHPHDYLYYAMRYTYENTAGSDLDNDKDALLFILEELEKSESFSAFQAKSQFVNNIIDYAESRNNKSLAAAAAAVKLSRSSKEEDLGVGLMKVSALNFSDKDFYNILRKL